MTCHDSNGALIEPPQRRMFPNGTLIFREGEPGTEAYLIESGRVEIIKMIEGKPVVLAEIGERGMFGEMALIDDQPRMAGAVARAETICIVLSKSKIKDQLARSPQGVSVMMRSLLRIIRVMGRELAEARVAAGHRDKPLR